MWGRVIVLELSVLLDFESDATLCCRFPQSIALVLGFAKINDHFREPILRDTCRAR